MPRTQIFASLTPLLREKEEEERRMKGLEKVEKKVRSNCKTGRGLARLLPLPSRLMATAVGDVKMATMERRNTHKNGLYRIF